MMSDNLPNLTMTPEEAEDLGKRLTALAAARRLGGTLTDNEEGALLTACLVLKSLAGKACFNDASFNTERIPVYDVQDRVVGHAVAMPQFTVRYLIPGHDHDGKIILKP